ncbi:MAG: hypothetical protein WA840_19770 [Caulobacteraceae bacterium]
MATAGIVHFSDFPAAATLQGSEGLAGLQAGSNVQITPTQIFSFVATTPGTLTNKTVSTAAAGDSSGAVASTQFVATAIAPLAPTNAPAFTGDASFGGASFSGAVTLASRPSFNGATPWDSANFVPANYLTAGSPVWTGTMFSTAGLLQTGGTIDATTSATAGYGIRTRASTAGTAAIQFANAAGSAAFGTLSTTSGGILNWSGATVYTSANFNPASYLPLTGGALSGALSMSSANLLGPGSNLRFSYNQDGLDAYIFQGSGNGLNLTLGSVANSAGAFIATGTSGASLGLGSTGISVSTFSNATVGSATPTSTTIAAINTTSAAFNSPILQNGNQVWHAGNFNPTLYATLNSPTFSGGLAAFNMTGTQTMTSSSNSGNAALMINQTSATAGGAYVAFLNGDRFGALFGLDIDNQLKVGGWSYGEVAHVILHDGNYSSYAVPVTGGSFTGAIFAPIGEFGDGNYSMFLSGGNPILNFNTNCFLSYTRSSGLLQYIVNSGAIFSVDAGGNVSGNGGYTAGGNGNFNDVEIRSDRRLKVVDGPIHDATQIIQNTRAYRGAKSGASGFFLIADEAAAITPELVRPGSEPFEGGDPLLSLDLLSYVPILLEEVKRLRQEVEMLKVIR